jgi:glycosyltransferase involved in cell wall biosynthesis
LEHVAHLTSVHRLQDVRINLHECQTLAAAGFDVTLIGPRSAGESMPAGINYIRVRPSRRRLGRMTLVVARLYLAARATRATVFHLHDPELLLLAPFLRLRGARVVYDAHEDLPRQVLSKDWIPRRVRPGIGRLVAALLPWIASVSDVVVAATDQVAGSFSRSQVVTLWNYPRLEEFRMGDVKPFRDRPSHVTYVGGVTPVRGIHHMVRAMSLVEDPDVRLRIAGDPEPATYRETLTATPGSDRVDLLGWVGRSSMVELLGDALAGLVVMPPAPQHAAGIPTKMFEYMAAGLPVIVSDFPGWRRIIEESDAGIAVDPEDPGSIAKAIDWVAAHRDEAEAMGRRGRAAVVDRYNWEAEGPKLLMLYDRLIEASRRGGSAA